MRNSTLKTKTQHHHRHHHQHRKAPNNNWCGQCRRINIADVSFMTPSILSSVLYSLHKTPFINFYWVFGCATWKKLKRAHGMGDKWCAQIDNGQCRWSNKIYDSERITWSVGWLVCLHSYPSYDRACARSSFSVHILLLSLHKTYAHGKTMNFCVLSSLKMMWGKVKITTNAICCVRRIKSSSRRRTINKVVRKVAKHTRAHIVHVWMPKLIERTSTFY